MQKDSMRIHIFVLPIANILTNECCSLPSCFLKTTTFSTKDSVKNTFYLLLITQRYKYKNYFDTTNSTHKVLCAKLSIIRLLSNFL